MKRVAETDEAARKRNTATARDNDANDERAIPWQYATNIDPAWIREASLTERVAAPTMDGNNKSVAIQLLDVTTDIQVVQTALVPNESGEESPVLQIFGLDAAGASAIVNVYGFRPYIYVDLPTGFNRSSMPAFQDALESALRNEVKARDRTFRKLVLGTEMVSRKSIMYYTPDNSPHIKITFCSPSVATTARSLLTRGLSMPGYGSRSFNTFESDLPFVMRFMIDGGLVGAGWCELPAGKYERLPTDGTTCSNVFGIFASDMVARPPSGEWLKIAPLRIFSFDIECAARKGTFPDAKFDPVIQIASILMQQGDSVPLVRTIFTLNKCAAITGADVRCYETESEMLLAWSLFVRATDPDIFTGYNIVNFDFPYLINRAAALKVADFPTFARITSSQVRAKEATFSSQAVGKRDSMEILIQGRVVFDAFQVIQRDVKLRSYSLNAVSAHFLKEQKEDVHHSIISDLQAGSCHDRRRLAVYCLKDAYLPLRLLEKLMSLVNYIEMARVTGVPLCYLLTRGQQVKVLSQIYRYASTESMIIPFKERAPNIDTSEKGYEGAVVIDPVTGFYKPPIATLDFASLYPSIMMAHNLCYTTLVRPSDVGTLAPDQVEITPAKDCFVLPAVRRGLLPRILEELLAARKQAKEDMKNETDPFRRAVYDGRQLALKVVCNSVYGFTGAQIGKLPCLEISSSVTAFGREMILKTRELVLTRYTKQNGYSNDARVVYGDTDSVMVLFGVESVAEAMALGKEAAEFITTQFVRPIKLEFEKVYCPYLLLNKKRYAGMYWTKPNKYDYMDTKGIESVRRDNCPLVKIVIESCLHRILIEQDPEGAILYVKGIIAELLQNKMDVSMLVISKGLTKSEKDYKNPNIAHVVLAERMRKRDPGSAPNTGDRISYVIIQGTKKGPAYEKCEDPLFVLENNIPIDTQYYLENQLKGPVSRILAPFVKNTDSLLTGDHTRHIAMQVPTSGALTGFATRRVVCIGCRGNLQPTERTVCSACKPYEAEIYQRFLLKNSRLETEFSTAWTQCQRCQGSVHQKVLCASRDCSIFYLRKKIQIDLDDTQRTLQRFEDDDAQYDW